MPARLLALLLAAALPAAARADPIAFEAIGTVTSVTGASALGPVAQGTPFRATVWFDPAGLGDHGHPEMWLHDSGMAIHLGKATLATCSHWWGINARIERDHFYIPDPGAYDGKTPVIEHYVRFEGSTHLRDRPDEPMGYRTTLTFRFPHDGPAVPPDGRMLTSLDQARASESRVVVTSGDWTVPPEQRFSFSGTFTEIRALGPWRPTHEPGSLALAAIGAGLALLARRARQLSAPAAA